MQSLESDCSPEEIVTPAHQRRAVASAYLGQLWAMLYQVTTAIKDFAGCDKHELRPNRIASISNRSGIYLLKHHGKVQRHGRT